MNARELIQELEDLDPHTEVRLMEQPSWPFEYSISGTWTPNDPSATCEACGYAVEYDPDRDEYHHIDLPAQLDAEHEPEVNRDSFTPEGRPEHVVYLLEGTQLAYGTKDAWS